MKCYNIKEESEGKSCVLSEVYYSVRRYVKICFFLLYSSTNTNTAHILLCHHLQHSHDIFLGQCEGVLYALILQ